jgi:hypothetical protein
MTQMLQHPTSPGHFYGASSSLSIRFYAYLIFGLAVPAFTACLVASQGLPWVVASGGDGTPELLPRVVNTNNRRTVFEALGVFIATAPGA